jgi:heme/copper-type cytochrome/quinol oxidase subunit 4
MLKRSVVAATVMEKDDAMRCVMLMTMVQILRESRCFMKMADDY